MNYEFFMKEALKQAENALFRGEFPVGCVLVYKDDILTVGSRTSTSDIVLNEIDHAEIIALRKLSKLDRNISYSEISLFSTMEPCLMCFGAILISKITKIIYAYEDVMGGGTNCNLTKLSPLYKNSDISIVPNIMRSQSLALFKSYFKNPKNSYLKGSLLASYTLNAK